MEKKNRIIENMMDINNNIFKDDVLTKKIIEVNYI